MLAAYVVNEYLGCLSWFVGDCVYGTFLPWYLWLSSMKKDVEILEVNMATLNVETMSLMSSRIANGMTSLQLSLIVCLVTYSQSHIECISRLWVSRVVPLAQPSARMEWIRCRQTERNTENICRVLKRQQSSREWLKVNIGCSARGRERGMGYLSYIDSQLHYSS